MARSCSKSPGVHPDINSPAATLTFTPVRQFLGLQSPHFSFQISLQEEYQGRSVYVCWYRDSIILCLTSGSQRQSYVLLRCRSLNLACSIVAQSVPKIYIKFGILSLVITNFVLKKFTIRGKQQDYPN